MNAVAHPQPSNEVPATDRYARAVAASRRVRWDIDADVIRGRTFDFARKFLPDGLTHATRIDFLDAAQRRFLSQVQGEAPISSFRSFAPNIRTA